MITDDILTAWKKGDEQKLRELRTKIPKHCEVLIVNPDARHPTVILGAKRDIAELQLRYGNVETRWGYVTARRELEPDTPIDGYVVPEPEDREPYKTSNQGAKTSGL